MARNENPPFERGMVDSAGTFATLIGKTFVFEDTDFGSGQGAKARRTGKYVTVMVVKNSSGFALLPKRLVTLSTVAGEVGVVKGYSRLTAGSNCYPVDEFIPAAGVPDGSYFLIVVGGPAMCLMPLSNLSADVAVGDYLVNITAATTGATTAGRVAANDLTGATAVLAAQIMHRIGRALSAKLTNATNEGVLVDIQQVF